MSEEAAAPTEGQAAATEGQAAATWTDGVAEDLRGYLEVKGFKDVAALATSYQNLEKLRGVPEDKLLRLPDKMDPDALAPIYDKLGRPESAEKYSRAVPEGFDGNVYKAAAETAHKLGLNDAQFKGLQEVMVSQSVALEQARDTATAQEFDAWKAKNAEGFNTAARVMATLGVDEASLAGILSGNKTALYDFLAKVGARSSEGQIVQGAQPGSGEFGLSPAGAKARIAELMGDKTFMEQYLHKSATIRDPAVARMTRLQEAAAKGA